MIAAHLLAPAAFPICISVLDSSFNPPTLAHLALARTTRPPSASCTSDAHRNDFSNLKVVDDAEIDKECDYDARLLLLSVRNADKALKPGDANYEQRLEMMALLAKELQHNLRSSISAKIVGADGTSVTESREEGNIAVAIIDEPTFVKKSSILRQFTNDRLAQLLVPSEFPTLPSYLAVELTFLMGFDTLERFLASRYYGGSEESMYSALQVFFAAPPHGDASRVLCAWRGNSKKVTSITALDVGADALLVEEAKRMKDTMSLAQPYINASYVSFTDISDREMTLSSSEVRAKRANEEEEWKDMVPSTIQEYIDRKRLYISN